MVRLQTEAKLYVQEMIRRRDYKLAWSAVIDLENNANPDADHRQAIMGWRNMASVDVPAGAEVEALAEQLFGQGVKPMDALHVASAIVAGADYFLTTDKALLRKSTDNQRIRVVDPVDFIREVIGDNDEN